MCFHNWDLTLRGPVFKPSALGMAVGNGQAYCVTQEQEEPHKLDLFL